MEMTAAGNIGAAFVIGLLGSLHCIGMCGPLASIGCRAGLARFHAAGPLLFVIGKLGGYAVLGLAAGAVGAAFIRSGTIGTATAYASLFGGILMLLILALSHLRFAARLSVPLTTGVARFSMKTGGWAPLLLGVGAALLPCGLLYAMVARSAAAGEPVLGMSLMVAFGAGTSPALVGVGTLLRSIPQRWSRWGSLAGEIVLALTALVLIWRGIAGLMLATTGHACCH